jgi:HD-GYP domain-containing protein (c-di-GMP phosphodiesterase class II)
MLEMSVVTQTLARPALFMALSQDRTVDPLLSQHALATCGLSMILAHAAHFDLLKLQALAAGALLHDIGLLRLPTRIRRRCFETSAPLSQPDQRLYQSHPRLAAMTLQRQGGFSSAICQLVAEHHALLDDTGFPKEARGSFTTDMTRVIMVTDRYDELLTGFGGASPMTPHQTLQRLYEEGRAGKYESVYISLFVKVLGIYPVYSCVELNTKERAIVTVINSKKLHLPIITITHDLAGTPYIVPLVIDLANQDERAPHRSVVTVIEASDAIVAALHHASA